MSKPQGKVITKPEWKVFIREMNKTGDKIAAYLKAYPKTKDRKSAATSAERLLKNADIQKMLKSNPEIQQKAIDKVVDELKDEIKRPILDSQRKREILFQIATGEHRIEVPYTKKNGTKGTYFRKPNPLEVAKAIEIDNRMAGDDAPQKHQHDVNGELEKIYKKALSIKEKYGSGTK